MNSEDTARKEKHYTKEHILYDSTYTKFTGALDPQIQKTGGWVARLRGESSDSNLWCMVSLRA